MKTTKITKETTKKIMAALTISITCIVMLYALEFTNQNTMGTTALFGFGATFSIAYLFYHEKDIVAMEKRFKKRFKRAIRIIAQEYYATKKGTSN